MTEENKSGTNKLKIGLIVVAALLLLSLIGNIIYMSRTGRLNDAKEDLKVQVENLQNQVAELGGIVESRDGVIEDLQKRLERTAEEHKALVQEKDVRIAQLSRRAQANANDLKAQMEENELLSKAKEALRDEMEALSDALAQAVEERDALALAYEQLREQAGQAERMMAYNVFMLTKWDRWLFADRYNVSEARRVDQIFIHFEVDGSLFTEAGNKEVHLLLYDPRGELLFPSPSQFTMVETHDSDAALSQSHYTIATQIDYRHKPVAVNFHIDHSERLSPGTYLAEIYIDGVLVRTHEKELK